MVKKLAQMTAVGGIVVSITAGSAVAQPSPLWQLRNTPTGFKNSPDAVRSLAVQVNVGRLRSGDNARFLLTLPGGPNVTVVKSGETRTPKGLVWQGKVDREPASAVSFSVVNEAVVGSILTQGRSFRLRQDRGVQSIEEVDLRKVPPEAEPTPASGRRSDKGNDPSADTCATDSPDQIDVMVVYTQDARDGAGSADAIEADIYLAVDQSNQTYINSNINQRLRLVHIAEVTYTESGNSTTDKNNLKSGAVAGVHALRDSHGADLVAMLVEKMDGACGESFVMETVGNAFENSAFAAIKRSCSSLAGKHSFPHELGHIMSARHDWAKDSTDNAPYAFNHGHTQPAPASGSPWRTIMAYENACVAAGVASCPRVLNWSNPNIDVGGSATGVATGAQQQDNHQTLNNTALTVANFRCSSPGRNDVWMKDTWSDTGLEPDPAQAALAMWESPYIWVQNAQDIQSIHQHEHQDPIKDQPNFIYVKIHNGGAATSGNLEVRIANASVGLSWPTDWTVVSSVPVGTFAAHTTQIIEVPWTPTAEGHYCLIARWISASDPMTTAETSDIDANVRGNNNIVWHNVNIVKLGGDAEADASFLVQTADRVVTTSLTVRPAPPRRRVSPPMPTFLDFGQVRLKLDEKLMAAWRHNNFAGTGFKRSGNIVTVTDKKGATLNFGKLDAKFKARAGIDFIRPKAGKFPRDEFLVQVIQGKDAAPTKPVGGVSYQVSTRKV
jgi:hypothetical protein